MDIHRVVDKFPYKKILPLNWYEAAIGHLLFFKNFKQRMNNNVYFLICDKGILLKAVTPEILNQSEEEVNKFFKTAKIEELDLEHTAQFYEDIVKDFKEVTSNLKDKKDCPYITLVYSDKIKQSCLALRKFGYNKPYEIWQQWERDKKGFCFLIVRPDYRWKEIANIIYNLVKKKEAMMQKPSNEPQMYNIEVSYVTFIWFSAQKAFEQLRSQIELKQRKIQHKLIMSIPITYPQIRQLQRLLDSVTHVVMPQNYQALAHVQENSDLLVLTTNQLEKLTQNLYHQFGISNLVKNIRQINGCLIVGSIDLDYWINKKEQQLLYQNSLPSLHRIQVSQVTPIYRLGHRTEIVEYDEVRYLCRRILLPVDRNLIKCLKNRLPCLPRYFFYYQYEDNIFLLRHFYSDVFQDVYKNATAIAKLEMLSTLVNIIMELHKLDITVGKPLKQCVFVEGNHITIECSGGNKHQDVEEITSYLKNISIDNRCETDAILIQRLQDALQDVQLKKVGQILRCYLNTIY